MTTPSPSIDRGQLLRGLLDILAGATPMPHQFDRLAQRCGLAEGVVTIAFFTGLRQVLADLPEHAFAERQLRLTTLDAVQSALDSAIEREEARLEAADSGEARG